MAGDHGQRLALAIAGREEEQRVQADEAEAEPAGVGQVQREQVGLDELDVRCDVAPGTGTPEPGGFLSRELLRAIRRIVGAVELAGMDIVEVSPPYDHAEVTAMIANRAALEAISALAVKRREGRSVRFEGHGRADG